jgi:hypothetical protein
MVSGSNETLDAAGLGQSPDPRDGVQGRPAKLLVGETGLYDGMYGGASFVGGGMSGAKLIIDGARESGSDEVDGWYDRWTGETLCEILGEHEYEHV